MRETREMRNMRETREMRDTRDVRYHDKEEEKVESERGEPTLRLPIGTCNPKRVQYAVCAVVSFAVVCSHIRVCTNKLLRLTTTPPSYSPRAGNFDPITSIGATDWVNVRANVSVMLRAPTPPYAAGDPMVPFPTAEGLLTDKQADPISKGIYGGVCVRQIDQFSSGVCLLVGIGLTGLPAGATSGGWVLQGGAMGACSPGHGLERSAGAILASGSLDLLGKGGAALSAYHTLSLGVQGAEYTAIVDGDVVVAGQSFDKLTGSIPPVGQVALRSSFSYVQFDELAIDHLPQNTSPTTAAAVAVSTSSSSSPPPSTTSTSTATTSSPPSATSHQNFASSIVAKHLIFPPTPPPGGPQQPTKVRSDFTGRVGCSFTPAKAVNVDALARFAVSTTGGGASRKHDLFILHGDTLATLATVSVDLEAARGGDLNGYAWAPLPKAVSLAAGTKYVIASSEVAGGDDFYDGTVWVTPQPGMVEGLFVPWYDGGAAPAIPVAWHQIVNGLTGECFDARGGIDKAIDTWDCVGDAHNEGFNYSATTGLITLGPFGDEVKEAGLCVVGVKASEANDPVVRARVQTDTATASRAAGTRGGGASSFPATSHASTCDPSDPNQVFSFNEGDSTLRLRSEADLCLTASSSPKEDAGLLLAPCTLAKPTGEAQMWSFKPIDSKPLVGAEWGQCYGPLNMRFVA